VARRHVPQSGGRQSEFTFKCAVERGQGVKTPAEGDIRHQSAGAGRARENRPALQQPSLDRPLNAAKEYSGLGLSVLKIAEAIQRVYRDRDPRSALRGAARAVGPSSSSGASFPLEPVFRDIRDSQRSKRQRMRLRARGQDIKMVAAAYAAGLVLAMVTTGMHSGRLRTRAACRSLAHYSSRRAIPSGNR
jgi:hypothetical protein